MDICSLVFEQFQEQLRHDYECVPIEDGSVLLITPYLDHWNDHLEIRVRSYSSGMFRVSDGRGTTDELFLHGLDLLKNKTKENKARQMARNLGVIYEDGELFAECTSDNISGAIRAVAQAMLRIDSLINTTQLRETKDFREDVAAFFGSHRIPFARDTEVQGKMTKHRIDFIRTDGKDRLVRTLSTKAPGRAKELAMIAVYSFEDILKVKDVIPISVYDSRFDVWTREIVNILLEAQVLVYSFPHDNEKLLERMEIAK